MVLDVSAVHPLAGGGHTYAHMLSRHLPSVGIDPWCLTRRRDSSHSWDGRRTLAVVPDRRPVRLVWEQTALLATLTRRFPDARVLHGVHYTMPERPRQRRLARIVTVHDLTFFTHPAQHSRSKRTLFRRAIRVAAQRADHLICVSDQTADDLVRLVDVRVPIEVIPHGIDLTHFSPVEPHQGHDQGVLAEFGVNRPYVLHLGTIEPRKNVQRLLDAVGRLRSSGFADPDVVLVGGAWPGAREALRIPADVRVRHLGVVRDNAIPALLRCAAAVAYPSLAEGFGLPVIEALAAGAPVVTSAGSVMERLADGAAILVDSEDVNSLADGIAIALAGDGPRPARRLAVAGTFDVRTCVDRHAQLYRRYC